MILIIESGSTKADWIILNNGDIDCEFATEGLNPYANKNAVLHIKSTVKAELLNKDISEIYFYGAGIVGEKQKLDFASAFAILNASKVEVNGDLLAAARATCGGQPGIVCILGTGSNIGYFDGEIITSTVASGGYLLGGEGSGMALGKEILKMYMRNQLSLKTEQSLESDYQITKENIIDQVYTQKVPNRYLASFAPFIHQLEKEVKNKITAKVFETFLTERILKLNAEHTHPIHFVGSIAYSFAKEIEDMLKSHNLELGKIIDKPIHNLVNYHVKSN